jgi:hypothetical protein
MVKELMKLVCGRRLTECCRHWGCDLEERCKDNLSQPLEKWQVKEKGHVLVAQHVDGLE